MNRLNRIERLPFFGQRLSVIRSDSNVAWLRLAPSLCSERGYGSAICGKQADIPMYRAGHRRMVDDKVDF
jgi:hypothetical protein